MRLNGSMKAGPSDSVCVAESARAWSITGPQYPPRAAEPGRHGVSVAHPSARAADGCATKRPRVDILAGTKTGRRTILSARDTSFAPMEDCRRAYRPSRRLRRDAQAGQGRQVALPRHTLHRLRDQ